MRKLHDTSLNYKMTLYTRLRQTGIAKLRRNKLAQYSTENNSRQLWSEINKSENNNQFTAHSIDGLTESVELAEGLLDDTH